MNSKAEQTRRAEHCNNGAQHYVCSDCAAKYRTRKPYEGIMSMNNNTCYICDEHKTVGPSRKLFGFHRFV